MSTSANCVGGGVEGFVTIGSSSVGESTGSEDIFSVIGSMSKPKETSFNSTLRDLFRKTTGGGFVCRFNNDANEELEE